MSKASSQQAARHFRFPVPSAACVVDSRHKFRQCPDLKTFYYQAFCPALYWIQSSRPANLLFSGPSVLESDSFLFQELALQDRARHPMVDLR